MRVVIVGGAGFIGTALAVSMRRHGHATLVLDTAPRLDAAASKLAGTASSVFDFSSPGDARDHLDGADTLVHLGCTTNPAQSMDAMVWDAESNIAPSVRLFDAAATAGVRRVVFASSGGTVYGAPARLPVAETDPTNPLCAYGVSKLAIEKYLALYTAFEGISLRPANPYGPYQLGGALVGVIAHYVAAVANGSPIQVWGDGSVTRDYIAIEDVCEAFTAAATHPGLASGAYNIGCGHGSSLNEIIQTVFAAADRSVPVDYTAARDYDVPAIVLDCAKFRQATSWTPRTTLDDGIKALWLERVGARPPSENPG